MRQLSLDLGAPGVDLPAPVALRIGRHEGIAAQAAFEIDSGSSESREPGSDLAIGHGPILGAYSRLGKGGPIIDAPSA